MPAMKSKCGITSMKPLWIDNWNGHHRSGSQDWEFSCTSPLIKTIQLNSWQPWDNSCRSQRNTIIRWSLFFLMTAGKTHTIWESSLTPFPDSITPNGFNVQAVSSTVTLFYRTTWEESFKPLRMTLPLSFGIFTMRLETQAILRDPFLYSEKFLVGLEMWVHLNL